MPKHSTCTQKVEHVKQTEIANQIAPRFQSLADDNGGTCGREGAINGDECKAHLGELNRTGIRGIVFEFEVSLYTVPRLDLWFL